MHTYWLHNLLYALSSSTRLLIIQFTSFFVVGRHLTASLCSEQGAGPNIYKIAVLSQRWPRNAPYAWVPWKFSGLPDFAHGYYSEQFSRAFVRIDPLNVPTKVEVRSFIRSSDNRGTPKFWTVPGYALAPFSRKFLIGFYSDWPYKCTRQICSP